ncbi:RNAse P Rpr2/Rpp21/SNM1 subunit domain-containing protein [Cladochytrium replicatum]|nr:RNAse P Rpr2/Rpp21/SNM1 subunit domain-containing protein [Cladochytrium replicatum]
MGKDRRNKGGGGGEHRDAFQRMNFLYQAAQLYSNIAAEHYHDKQHGQATKEEQTQVPNDRLCRTTGLSRFYCRTMKVIAQKMVLRMDPQVKKSICQRCEAILVPGKTATARTFSKPISRIVTTCLCCGCQRSLPTSSRSHKSIASDLPVNPETAERSEKMDE